MKDFVKKLKKMDLNQIQIFVDVLPTAMILLDDKGRVCIVNATFEEMAGYKRDELVNKKLISLNLLSKESVKDVIGKFKTYEKGEEIRLYPIELNKKDGKKIWLQIDGTIVSINNQLYELTIVHDLTDLIEKEAKLQKIIDELQAKTLELEKFTNLFVGREDKMIKLKKQIMKLKKDKTKALTESI